MEAEEWRQRGRGWGREVERWRQGVERGTQWRGRHHEKGWERASWRNPTQGEQMREQNRKSPVNRNGHDTPKVGDRADMQESQKKVATRTDSKKQPCHGRKKVYWNEEWKWTGNERGDGWQSQQEKRGEGVIQRQHPHLQQQKRPYIQRGTQWGERLNGRREERAGWREQGERQKKGNERPPGNKSNHNKLRVEHWAETWENLRKEFTGSDDNKPPGERRGGIYWENGSLIVENSRTGWAEDNNREGRLSQQKGGERLDAASSSNREESVHGEGDPVGREEGNGEWERINGKQRPVGGWGKADKETGAKTKKKTRVQTRERREEMERTEMER